MYRPSQTPHLTLSSDKNPQLMTPEAPSTMARSMKTLNSKIHLKSNNGDTNSVIINFDTMLIQRQNQWSTLAKSIETTPAIGHIRYHRFSEETMGVVVFHRWHSLHHASHLFYTSHVSSPCQTRVKLNRVFFPRCLSQARSLDCLFARW